MKKTSKFFGTIALSAALAMGCMVPAFAETAPGAGEDATDDVNYTGEKATLNEDKQLKLTDDDEGSSTVVQVTTYTSQLNVTVPLTLPVALDRAGGYGKAPTNYFIQNDSVPSIEVLTAEYEMIDTEKWSFKDGADAFAPSDGLVALTKKGTNAASGTAETMPTVGSMLMQLAPKDAEHFTGDAWTTDVAYSKTSGSSSNTIWTLANGGTKDVNWVIPGTADNPGEDADAAFRKLVMDIEASSSTLNADIETATPLAKITYTIGLAAPAEATPGA